MAKRATALGSAVLCLFVGYRSQPFGQALRADVTGSIGRILEREGYAGATDFSTWPAVAAEHRPDEATTPAAFTAALNKALRTYGVSHLSVMSPAEASARSTGSGIGIGAMIQTTAEGLVVTAMAPDGPAAEAGLRPGDVIVTVDGESARDVSQITGSSVLLQWQRGATPGKSRVTLRQAPSTPPDGLRWLDEEIALVGVRSFVDGRYDRRRIDGFFESARRASGLILDLRSNTGGNADNVRHLVGHLLPADRRILADVYRKDADRFRRRHRSVPADAAAVARWLDRDYRPIAAGAQFTGPVAVLVDGRSASGGELAPAVLQEQGRALLVGSDTRGKVRIGDMFDLPGGFVLQAPIGEFVTSGGRVVEGNPVVPDVRLTESETAQDSIVLDHTLRIVNRR